MSNGCSGAGGFFRSPPSAFDAPSSLPLRLLVHEDVMRKAGSFGVAGLADGDDFGPGFWPFTGFADVGWLHGLSPMCNKDVGRRTALPKPFSIGFRPSFSSPAGLLALGSSAGPRLPDGVVSISDWLSPCGRRPRLQRRDRHGLAPCSGILDAAKVSAMPDRVKCLGRVAPVCPGAGVSMHRGRVSHQKTHAFEPIDTLKQ